MSERISEDEVIDLLETYYQARQPAPSVREIADHFGLARSTAAWHIDRMVKKGLLVRPPGVARGLRVAESKMKADTHEL